MDIKLKNGSIVTIPDDRILANDVTFPHEYNPHNVRLWVIGNEYGAICAVWADCEQEALDEALDAGKLDSFLVEPEDVDPDLLADGFYAHLGNAGEITDLSYCSMEEISLNDQDMKFIIALAEARGAGHDNLEPF